MTAALALLLASLPSAAAPIEAPRPTAGVRLTYRFTPGETVRYRIEHAVQMLAVKGAVTERSVSRARTDQHYEVTGVADDGTATLRLVIAAARMEASFNAESPVIFDSTAKTAPPRQYLPVSRAVGTPLAEIQVRPDGTVAKATPLLAAGDLAALGGGLGRTAEEAGGLFDVFPDRRLCVGDEWSDTFKVKVSVTTTLRREVTLLRTYRLERLNDGVAVVAFRTVLLTPVTEPGLLVQLIQRQFAGTLRFDATAGRLMSKEFASDNTELGWAGDDSSLRAIGRRTEELLPPDGDALSAR